MPLSQMRKVSEKVNTNMISLLAITRQLLKSSRDAQQKYSQSSSERGEKEGNTRSNTPTGKKPNQQLQKNSISYITQLSLRAQKIFCKWCLIECKYVTLGKDGGFFQWNKRLFPLIEQCSGQALCYASISTRWHW